MNNTYSQIDPGTGELLTYPDNFAGLTPADAAEASQAQSEILNTLGEIQTSYIRLGSLLCNFEEKGHYKALGYPTFKDWLADPNINLGSRVAHDLMRIVREAIPILVQHNALDALPRVSTMRSLLPVLNEGDEEFVDLVRDVKDMPVREVYEKLRERKGLTNTEKYVKAFLHKGKTEAFIKFMVIGDTHSYDAGTLRIKLADLPEALKIFSSQFHIEPATT